MKTQVQLRNIYSETAAERACYRDSHLYEPQPPKRPDKSIRINRLNPQAVFKPSQKIKTAKDLKKELARYRKKHLPFLKNYAPPLSVLRHQIALTRFKWRRETQEDLKQFDGTLSGQGKWKIVTIPHYGEPLGKAVTYYFTTVKLTQKQLGQGAIFLCFKGVDYKTQVYFNHHCIGTHEGFFDPFEFECTSYARPGRNLLLIRVENDYVMNGSEDETGQKLDGDKVYAATGLGYDDPVRGWHHCPPGMGIYNDVYLEIRNRTYISDLYVRPIYQKSCAQAWIEVSNSNLFPEDITLQLTLTGQNFRKTVFKNLVYTPVSTREIGLGDDLQYAKEKAAGTLNDPVKLSAGKGTNSYRLEFDIPDFRPWEPDSPWLYQLQVRLVNRQGIELDNAVRQFGMRSFQIDTANSPKGQLLLNGRPIRLRGANTMGHEQQCVLQKDYQQLIDDILLAKICNMNFLRLTQRPVQDEIYQYCDQLGMMLQTDLPTFGAIHRSQLTEALRQMDRIAQITRPHPSVIILSYINEPMPNSCNKPHRNLSRSELQDFFTMADRLIKQRNPDIAVKPTDGDYDPPSPGLPDRHCYTAWYNGQGVDIGKLHKGYWQLTTPNWYYACGEFGSEGLDPIDLMKKFYPKTWVKEKNGQWTPDQIIQQQSGLFHYFFYDTPNTMAGWVNASQNYQAQATRTMTEAFRRDNRMVSFAIHLFIDAFPSGWMKAIMDCQRHPKKAYFAYRDALAPLLPCWRTDRYHFYSGETISLESWLCNDKKAIDGPMFIHYQFEINDQIVLAQRCKTLHIPASLSHCLGNVQILAPKVRNRTTMTARIGILTPQGQVINDSAIELTIFPRPPRVNFTHIGVLGLPDGPATAIGKNLNIHLQPYRPDITPPQTLLIDDFSAYIRHKSDIDRAILGGMKAIFIHLPSGELRIADQQVHVKESSFNPLHFVSRQTGHSLVAGFEPNDFKFWHNPNVDRITPILTKTFTAQSFNPILTSGNLNSEGQWVSQLAAGDRPFGLGSICICLIELANRAQTNPTARQFLTALLAEPSSRF